MQQGYKERQSIDEYGDLRKQHHELITFQIENGETLEIFEKVKIPQKHI